MAVYDDQDTKRKSVSDKQLRQATGMSAEEEAAAKQRAYDEQFADIARAENDAENERSSRASQDILRREREAATGKKDANATIGRNGGGTAGPQNAGNGSSDDTGGSGGKNGSDSTFKNLFRQESEGGGFYRDEGEKKKRFGGKLRIGGGSSKQNKRILIIMASMFAGVASAVGGLFVAVMPFQIPSITQFLEDQKYAAFNNATDKTFQHLFTAYLTYALFPGMRDNGCASTKVDRHCARVMRGEGPVRILFNKWSGADSRLQSLEYKLALKGIEITSSNGRYFMKSPSLDNPVDLSEVANGTRTNIFDMKEVSRGNVRAELKRTMEGETFFKKLLYHFRIGALLKKHGIIRCMMACDFRDNFHDKIEDKKRAGIAYLNRRVFEPRSVLLSLYIECLLRPCSDELRSGGTDGDESTNGEPMDEIRRETRSRLSAFSAPFGADKLNDLVKKIENLNRDGLSAHMTKMAIERLGGSVNGGRVTGEIISKFAGPIGWVLAAARLLILAYDAYQLKVMNYALNAALGVSVFELLRTTAHETRSSHIDATMLGSMTNILRHGPFNQGPGLEDSPVYDATFASATSSPASAFMRTVLPQKAYAQTATNSVGPQQYMCNDGRTIYKHAVSASSASNLVCDEMRLGLVNIFTRTSDLLRSIPGLDIIVAALRPILGIISAIEATIENIARLIPGVAAILDKIAEWLLKLLNIFMLLIMKNPLGDRPSGARMGEIAIMGAEVGGQQAAHRLLGGQVLTPAQQTAILQEEQAKKQEAFAHLPLKERLFSMDYTYSLTSQLALTLPSDLGGAARQSFASLLSNPFGKLASSAGSVFTMNYAYAAPVAPQASSFDVVPHGIPIDDPFFKSDPLKYWDTYCENGKIDIAYNTAREDIQEPELKKYGFILDDMTAQVINEVANPCFMLSTMSKYDEAPKPPPGSGPGGPAGPGIPGATCNDVPSCAQALLNMKDTQLVIRPGAEQDLKSAVAGTPIPACSQPQLNLTLLQLMNQLAAKYKYRINNFLTGRNGCDTGFNPKGRAVDVDGVNGVEATGAPGILAAEPFKTFGRDVMAALPAGGGLGQKQCFGDVGPTTGKRYFDDDCDHVHIDVGASAP